MPPDELGPQVAVALQPLGYQAKVMSSTLATYERSGLSTLTGIVLLLIPIVGWIILFMILLGSTGPKRITMAMRADGGATIATIEAMDPSATDFFEKLGAEVATASPGWHPDPDDARQERYWDGTRWTDQRRSLAE